MRSPSWSPIVSEANGANDRDHEEILHTEALGKIRATLWWLDGIDVSSEQEGIIRLSDAIGYLSSKLSSIHPTSVGFPHLKHALDEARDVCDELQGLYFDEIPRMAGEAWKRLDGVLDQLIIFWRSTGTTPTGDRCSLCGEPFDADSYRYDAFPVSERVDAECCGSCYGRYVIPTRAALRANDHRALGELRNVAGLDRIHVKGGALDEGTAGRRRNR